MARPLSDFTARVLAECPGAPGALAELRIRDVVRQFCKRSAALTSTLAPINIAANVRDYTLTPPASHEILSVPRVTYDGMPLGQAAKPSLDRNSPYHESVGAGFKYYLPSKTTLRLTFDPVTAITAGLVATAILLPTVDAVELDDSLYDDWVDELAAGAAGYLQMMPKKPWSDPETGVINIGRFRGAILDARGRYATGGSNMPETAQPLMVFG